MTSGLDLPRRPPSISVVTCAALLLAVATSAVAQERQPDERRPQEAPQRYRGRRDVRDLPEDRTRRDFDRDCLRSGCHARLNTQPWVHAPVSLGACEGCHERIGDEISHRFRPTRPETDLCIFCHRLDAPQASVHAAYENGQCIGCHDPHGGATPALLKAADVSTLCGDCHDASARAVPAVAAVAMGSAREISPESPDSPQRGGQPNDLATPYAHLHAPVEEGKCTDCHVSHQSEHDGLLVREERRLCLDCHEETTRQLESAAHVHTPAGTNCCSCHLPHGGDDRSLLRAAPRALCLSCHEEVLHPTGGATLHAPVRGESSCLDCHVAHADDVPELLVASPGAVCMGCHDERIELEDGAVIADIAAEIRDATYVHEPVAEHDCDACHSAHASPHGDLLEADYPRSMYSDFGAPGYQLCFSCHDARLGGEERTTITAFRDGDRNLHALHVKGTKGRTCAVCHTSHASELPALLRDRVLFGPRRWELPIGFRRTETGGACAPGCHQEFAYDNHDPAPGAETTRDSPAVQPDSTEN